MYNDTGKNFNLLDEQLATSGIENNILGVISGVASIAGGIFGASQASKANSDAKKAYKEQQKAAKEAAKKTNEYNKKVFEVDKKNYANNRKYEYETAIRQWKFNQSIQDYQYLQTVKQYGKSVENTRDQLSYNSLAAQQAYESEQSALNEIYTEDAFNRQGMMVDQLTAQGQGQLGQAGRSRTKALQSTLAEVGRNAAVMNASLSSSVKQTERNLRDISMRRYGADMQARASMMLRPERLPDLLEPTQAPERIFVEPMEVLPQAIAPPRQQSVFAPLVSGLTSGLGSFASSFGQGPVSAPSPQAQQYGAGFFGL